MTMKKTLGEIARFLEGRLAGDESIVFFIVMSSPSLTEAL